MKKNGNLLIAIIKREKLQRGVWDPYRYRENGKCEVLSDYADVERLNGKRPPPSAIHFAPLEYKHIPRGNYLTFILEPQATPNNVAMSVVPEQTLLFGTMRGYLGNIIVTPKAEWLGAPAPLWFAVKSEFVRIHPKDGLLYFWWAYLKSPAFLHNLPVGSGGTRPRLHGEALSHTPVNVPPLTVRRQIHDQLETLAASAWREFVKVEAVVRSMGAAANGSRAFPKSSASQYFASRCVAKS
jgi:restriction endonuclease S subunit